MRSGSRAQQIEDLELVKGVLKKTQASENAIFSGVAKSREKRKYSFVHSYIRFSFLPSFQ